jgi:predicted transcriptional regulator
VSTFESWLLSQITASWRRTRQPVRTLVLADLVSKHPRTVRYKLADLERRGVVQRRGQRGGWLPVRVTA